MKIIACMLESSAWETTVGGKAEKDTLRELGKQPCRWTGLLYGKLLQVRTEGQRAVQRRANCAPVWRALAISFLSVKKYTVQRETEKNATEEIMNCTACENYAHNPEDNLPLHPLMPAHLCDIFPLHKSLPWLRGRSGKQPLGETVPEKPVY